MAVTVRLPGVLAAEAGGRRVLEQDATDELTLAVRPSIGLARPGRCWSDGSGTKGENCVGTSTSMSTARNGRRMDGLATPRYPIGPRSSLYQASRGLIRSS